MSCTAPPAAHLVAPPAARHPQEGTLSRKICTQMANPTAKCYTEEQALQWSLDVARALAAHASRAGRKVAFFMRKVGRAGRSGRQPCARPLAAPASRMPVQGGLGRGAAHSQRARAPPRPARRAPKRSISQLA
jgi:hypothetical protein